MLDIMNTRAKLRYHIILRSKGMVGSRNSLEASYKFSRSFRDSLAGKKDNKEIVWIYDSLFDVHTEMNALVADGNMWIQGYPVIELPKV